MKRKLESENLSIDHVIDYFVPKVLDNPTSFLPESNTKVREDVIAAMKLLYDYGIRIIIIN